MQAAWVAGLWLGVTACGDGSTAMPDAAGDEIVIAAYDDMVPTYIAADDNGVVWAHHELLHERTSYRVEVLALDSGATSARTVHQVSGDYSFRGIHLVDDTVVYALEQYYYEHSEIFTQPRLGGLSSQLYSGSPGDNLLASDARDGMAILVVRPDGARKQVLRTALGSGVLSTVADDEPPLKMARMRTAVDASHAYWTRDGELWRGDESSIERFATTSGPVGALVLDDTNVYWIDNTGLVKLAKDAPGQPAILVNGEVGNRFDVPLVVDNDHAYWLELLIDGPVATLYMAPLDGSRAPVPVVVTDRGLYGLAVTSAGLYYTTTSGDSDDDGFPDQGVVALLPRASL